MGNEKSTRMFGKTEYMLYNKTFTKAKALAIKESLDSWANVKITETETGYKIWYKEIKK